MRRELGYGLLFALLTLLLSGCADDLRTDKLFSTSSENISLAFRVDKSDVSRGSDSWESDIDHAYLLFYDASDEELTRPVAATRAEVDKDSPGQLQFRIPLLLEQNVSYRMVAIANADQYVGEGYSDFKTYLETILNADPQSSIDELLLHTSFPINPDIFSWLPMRGMMSGSSMFRFSVENGVYSVSDEISLLFKRSVARVDVINKATDKLLIKEVALCNWRDAVDVLHQSENPGAIRGLPSEDTQFNPWLSYIAFPEAGADGRQRLTGALYSFPSETAASSPGDSASTALILCGMYDGDITECYYRVNIGVKGSLARLKENTMYVVSIESVSGRGAATPEEAYSSEESLVTLSVVEDWDLEGNYDIDDEGRFIVISRGAVEFPAETTEAQDVRVLTSRGLDLNFEFIPSGDTPAEAFRISYSAGILSVSPNDINRNPSPKTGLIRLTSPGTTLRVDLSVTQLQSGEVVQLPDIALVPEETDHVMVDHENRTITIDGFAPEVFNSFIDVPFKVHIGGQFDNHQDIEVYLDAVNPLAWPTEGRISKDKSSNYYYCQYSFVYPPTNPPSGKVCTADGKTISYSELFTSSITLRNEERFYISVGAMGPDDPAIERSIKIRPSGSPSTSDEWDYQLIIKPRTCIIDDVILSGQDGKNWLIMDRNFQLIDSNSNKYTGRNIQGQRRQAYNYTSWNNLIIPFKYYDKSNTAQLQMNETYHSEMNLPLGFNFIIVNQYGISFIKDQIDNFLKRYAFQSVMPKLSPYYDGSGISSSGWNVPTKTVLDLCQSKMKVSKLRMYLVSDVPAKSNGEIIPICCYWPFSGDSNSSLTNVISTSHGYIFSDDGMTQFLGAKLFDVINTTCPPLKYLDKSGNSFKMAIRLVRALDNDEIETYRNNYLGYQNILTLTPCHADTYTEWPDFTPVATP